MRSLEKLLCAGLLNLFLAAPVVAQSGDRRAALQHLPEQMGVYLRDRGGSELQDRGDTGQSSTQDRASFEKMVTYLSRDTGRWRAPNENHDPDNPRSAEAIGLWFERQLNGHRLELTIMGYFDGQPRPFGTRALWFWHPGEQHIVYQEISRNGSIRTGTAAFTNDSTFFTETEAVDSQGRRSRNRGGNFILNDRMHRTVAYAMGPDGGWVEQRSLTWTLETGGSEESAAAAKEYLSAMLGTWESQTEFFDSNGNTVREGIDRFTETVMEEGHLNLHTSHNPDGSTNNAFRFYSEQEDKLYMVDVTSDGSLWMLSGEPDGQILYSQEKELPTGEQ